MKNSTIRRSLPQSPFLFLFLFFAISFSMPAQNKKAGPNTKGKIEIKDSTFHLRGLVDTIGFAHKKEQMDLLMQRIYADQGAKLTQIRAKFDIMNGDGWRLAIAPHDDYSYTGYMYPLVHKNIQAKTVIIIGVAHKAAQLNLSNQLIFDSYSHWRGPYGNIKVSNVREALMKELPTDIYQVNDSMQSIEHSVEAELPYLQYFDKDVEIVSILVPPMSYARMEEIAQPFAKALMKVFKKKDLEWGQDVSILISTDAVHYGDEEWGGKDYSFFGSDSTGYKQAVEKENKIIGECLAGDLMSGKIKKFTQYTVQDNDYTAYKWTWCGRYSVPFGMLAALDLQKEMNAPPLLGLPLDYCTSIDHNPIKVDDMGMGVTAKAYIRHWVGYAALGFR
jgi:AmmeMemoRadiSam system protein B